MLRNIEKLPLIPLEYFKDNLYENLLNFISNNIYPIPKHVIKDLLPKSRIDNPLPVPYDVGDLVRLRRGPAKGRIGVIVVDRNENYKDYEERSRKESIGVFVTERPKVQPFLEQLVIEITGSGMDPCDGVVRWEEDSSQLELVKKSKPLTIEEAKEKYK